MISQNSQVDVLLEQIKSWPVASRIQLARRVLETVDSRTKACEKAMAPPLEHVIGLCNPSEAFISDEACDELLVEELIRKHAS